jgi:hypothetical protein
MAVKAILIMRYPVLFIEDRIASPALDTSSKCSGRVFLRFQTAYSNIV